LVAIYRPRESLVIAIITVLVFMEEVLNVLGMGGEKE
jgi:hypothetical protein